MDVYEKSLKTAQRGLPRKAEWGDAIVPQPQVPQPVITRLVVVDLVSYSFDYLPFPEIPSVDSSNFC